MSQRNALKGIAYGLVSTFTSRNNDLNGYWSLGMLRLYAQQQRTDAVLIDLLSTNRDIPSNAFLEGLGAKYKQWLLKNIEACGLTTHPVINGSV